MPQNKQVKDASNNVEKSPVPLRLTPQYVQEHAASNNAGLEAVLSAIQHVEKAKEELRNAAKDFENAEENFKKDIFSGNGNQAFDCIRFVKEVIALIPEPKEVKGKYPPITIIPEALEYAKQNKGYKLMSEEKRAIVQEYFEGEEDSNKEDAGLPAQLRCSGSGVESPASAEKKKRLPDGEGNSSN